MKKILHIKKRYIALLLLLLSLSVLFVGIVAERNRFQTVFTTASFSESSDFLKNKDRGFYQQIGFILKEFPDDYEAVLSQRLDNRYSLAMVQINLQLYRLGFMSDQAMDNLEQLFSALRAKNKRYIIRFLYDWQGKNSLFEPPELSCILKNIEQIGPIIQKNSDIIFTTQGLLIGNWGEMNGTAYSSANDLTALYQALRNAIGEDVYCAVRMPAQWRSIVKSDEPTADHHLGLFNDGMLGNYSDYGTYNLTDTAGKTGYEWNRQEELDFQNILGRYAPNGGEVIVDNPYNDYENAVSDLASMHVSYLNEAYDQNVHQKWKDYIITEPGCYEGMSGYDYIERHLGYRYLLDSADFQLSFLKNKLHFTLNLKNVGFAPIYSETKLLLTLKGNGSSTTYELPYDARTLAGGRDSEQLLPMQVDFPLDELEPGTYRLYFRMVGADGSKIALANTNHDEANGIYVGSFTFQRTE